MLVLAITLASLIASAPHAFAGVPQFTITASAGPHGQIDPVGAVSVNSGATQVFTITPDPNYHVDAVIVDGVFVGQPTNYQFPNVSSNHTISATFAIDSYTIDASAGPNGTIDPSGTINADFGSSSTFNVTPATNYHIADVVVDNNSVGNLTSYTFDNVQANHSISATFAIDSYVIDATTGPNGEISPSGQNVVTFDGSLAFNMLPDPNYQVADVLVDGFSVGAVTSYTFTNVSTSHTIAVSFALVVQSTAALSINDVHVAEGDAGTSVATFTVTVNPPVNHTIQVAYTTKPGSASTPEDFQATSGTLTIPALAASAPIAVTIKGDTKVEADETFKVLLSHAQGATLADSSGTGTIQNDDAQLALSVDDPSVLEGNSGSRSLKFTVTLSKPASRTVTVKYATKGVTASAGDHDYAAVSGTLTIPAGATSGTVSVAVYGDTRVEPDETLQLNLSYASNATIAKSQGIGTILNDDTGSVLPAIYIADVSKPEGNSGTKSFDFIVSLSTASAVPVTVKFATAGITASVYGKDYIGRNGTLTIPANATHATISVQVKGDKKVEANETFAVNLSNPVHATLGDAQGIGTIVNDDGAAVVAESAPPVDAPLATSSDDQEGETAPAVVAAPQLMLASNPVRGALAVTFVMPEDGDARLAVLDAQGRLVHELASGTFSAGRHSATLAGDARSLPPGMYFVRFQAGAQTIVQRFVTLR